jgi:branched-chain amino acid transport system permease protein
MFHVFKELTWNYFLGWQWVALGALIVVVVVFFQDGLMGYLKYKRPEWFGIAVDTKEAKV